jgi:hypothetical protein
MVVNGQGNRTGFQSVINDLKSRIQSWDCLLIHTNNHGWYDGNGGFLSAYGGVFYANDFAADLAKLPKIRTLLVVMEQCASGSFSQPIMDNSPATNTVFQAAVPGNESSAGGWPFDPWAEMWISAMAGVRGDGSPLAVSPDDNLDTLISASEAYDYAFGIDNPIMSESTPSLSENVFLSRCITKLKGKEKKEWKEIKEWKEKKEWKEWYEPKQVMESKQSMEPKVAYEGPELTDPYEHFSGAFDELGKRLERLELTVNKLTPFIQTEQRPDLKPKARDKSEK